MPDKEGLLWFTLDVGERKGLMLSWLTQLSSGFHSSAQPPDKIFTGLQHPGERCQNGPALHPAMHTESHQHPTAAYQWATNPSGVPCSFWDTCSTLGGARTHPDKPAPSWGGAHSSSDTPNLGQKQLLDLPGQVQQGKACSQLPSPGPCKQKGAGTPRLHLQNPPLFLNTPGQDAIMPKQFQFHFPPPPHPMELQPSPQKLHARPWRRRRDQRH